MVTDNRQLSESFFLATLKTFLFDKEHSVSTTDFSSLDWQYILHLSLTHNVSGIVYSVLRDHDQMPHDIKQELMQIGICAIRYNTLVFDEFCSINELAQEQGIPIVPIKGIANTLLLYEGEPIRNMLDIDTVVKPQDMRIMEDILKQRNYVLNEANGPEDYWRNQHFECEFVNEHFTVDLHWSFGFKFNTKPWSLYDISHCWKRVHTIKCEHKVIQCFSIEDNLMSLLLHQQHFGNRLQLKEICDFILYIKKYYHVIDWELLEDTLKRNEIYSLWAFMLSWTKRFGVHQRFFDLIPLKMNNLTGGTGIIKKYVMSMIVRSHYNAELIHVFILFSTLDRMNATIKTFYFVPYEQFCKFFHLRFSARTSRLFYFLRVVMIPFFTTYKLFFLFLGQKIDTQIMQRNSVKEYLKNSTNMLVKMEGDCMCPAIHRDDILTVKVIDAEELNEGDLILFDSGRKIYKPTCHRIVRIITILGKRIILECPDDSNYGSLIGESRIVGKVINVSPRIYQNVFQKRHLHFFTFFLHLLMHYIKSFNNQEATTAFTFLRGSKKRT